MKEEVNEEMSLSKQRKLARKKEIARKKRQAVINKVILVAVLLLVVGLIVWLIVSNEIKKSKQVTADTNYSAEIGDDGKVKGVNASDYVTIPDYKSVQVNLADVEYPDEDVQSDIDSVLSQHLVLDTSENAKAADGDKVNIDFVGKVDGEEFEGGTATGRDVTLGSGSLIDDFEDQIVGHSAGDKFDVEVTFPEDYANDETLAGKDAVFSVTLNGVYVKPEFNDEFVAANLSEYASTADGYRQYLKDKNYKSNLQTKVREYITANTELKKKPSDYLKQLKSNYKAYDQTYYEYMNSMYSSYLGSTAYSSFEDYLSKTYSKTEEEYDESLEDLVTDDMTYVLFCQAVADKEGITANIDEVREHYLAEGTTEDTFNSQLETYGPGFIVQQYLCEKVLDKICETAVVK